MDLRGFAANELARAAYWRKASTLKILSPEQVKTYRERVRALVASARDLRLEIQKALPRRSRGKPEERNDEP